MENYKIKAFLNDLTELTVRHGIAIDFNNGDNFDLVDLSEKFDGYSAEIMINGSVLAKADFIEDDDPHQIESRRLSGLSAHEKIELRCRRS
jgi:hypothetical protein